MAIGLFIKPLGFIAAGLGIVQGVVWFTLAFLTLLIHFDVWTPKLAGQTYGQYLSAAILNGYVNGAVSPGQALGVTLFVRPQEFFMWAFIYLFTSVLWIGFSSFLLYVLIEGKYQRLKKTCLGWAMWTTIISVCDLLLTSILASDYDTLVTAINSKKMALQGGATYLILACGVMMTLSAKGFLLWMINVTVDVIIIRIYLYLPKKMTDDFMESSMIDAQERGTSGRPGEPIRPNLFRSNSFASSTFGTFQGLPRLPPIQTTNERLAQLSRRSLRSRQFSSTFSRNSD